MLRKDQEHPHEVEPGDGKPAFRACNRPEEAQDTGHSQRQDDTHSFLVLGSSAAVQNQTWKVVCPHADFQYTTQMDGIHDLGGQQGHGPIEREPNEPVFHDRWEARVWAIVTGARQANALQNTDQFRHSIERIDPRAYLTQGYYGRWLGGMENLLVEAGVLDPSEIEDAVVARGGQTSDLVAARPSKPDFAPALPPSAVAARFVVGDMVTTVAHGDSGHTRLPAYARGKRGEVVLHHGLWPFPDTNAHGLGEQPQHLYTVRFDGAELWGERGEGRVKGRGSEANISVAIDLFEPYLL